MKKRVWLKQLRISRGLTQDAVATKAFIDRGFYAQIENGTRDPSMLVAGNIANALGVHPQIFFMEHFRPSSTGSEGSYVIYAQCDLDIRYTWLWHPFKDIQCYVGKRDDEISWNDGTAELVYLKKQVILQGVALEKVMAFPYKGRLIPCLARGEPLFDPNDRIIGVHTALTCMPSLLSSIQTVKSVEPRDVLRGHMLYFFSSKEAYLDRLYEYITDGVDYGYQLWIVESTDTYQRVRDRLVANLHRDQLKNIHYFDNEVVFAPYEEFSEQYIDDYFEGRMAHTLEHGIPLRTWARVLWKKEQHGAFDKLNRWETHMDEIVSRLGISSVCTYDATELPASFQTTLLRNHEYFMTDHELVYSPLYARNTRSGIIPSLAMLAQSRRD